MTATISLPDLVPAPPELESTPERALTVATNLRAVTAAVKDRQAAAEQDAAPDCWQGDDQQSATHAASRFARRLEAAEAALFQVVVSADTFEDGLRRLHRRRDGLVDRRSTINRAIEGLEAEITATPDPDEATVHGWQEQAGALRERREALETDVAAWVDGRDAAESEFVAALGSVDTRAEGCRAVAGLPDVALLLDSLRNHEGDPTLVNAWWRGRSTAEKQALITEFPGLIGNTDGIPVADRDEANRTALYRDLDHWSQRQQDGQLSDSETRALANARHVREQLQGFEDDIDPVTGDHLANLLVYKPGAHSGDGGVAFALGDPDRARHVSVNVGGLTTELSSLGGNLDRMEALHSAAVDQRSGSVATVFWHDYDAPSGDWQSLDGLRDLSGVISPEEAEEGAGTYADFLDGLRASDLGQGDEKVAHLTSIGHSYGSTLVAHAELEGTPADDVVLLGNPGVPAATAEALSDGTVWVGSKDYDPVTLLGFAGEPTDTDALGYDPAQASFGGNRFETGKGSHDLEALIVNHTSYYEGRSLDDVADVVVQNYGDVQPEEARGDPGGDHDGLDSLLVETGGEWLWDRTGGRL